MNKVLITPELAQKYYALNDPDNRPVSQKKVDTYARLMKAGKWHLTPDYISFTDRGTMYNGQHRMLAVIKSGVSVWMNVDYEGYNPESVAATDQGNIRSVSDIAKFLGRDVMYRSHTLQGFIRNIGPIKFGENKSVQYSRNEIIDMIDNFYYVCAWTFERSKKMKNTAVCIAVVSAFANGEPEDMIDAFVDELSGNINGHINKKVNHDAAAEAKHIISYKNYGRSSYKEITPMMTMDCQKLLFKYIHNRKTVKKGIDDIYPLSKEQFAKLNDELYAKSVEHKEVV